jgi:hypothetical protein
VVTDRASTRITSELRRRKFLMVGEPMICLVDGDDELPAAETDRAHAWATGLAAALDGGGVRAGLDGRCFVFAGDHDLIRPRSNPASRH